MNSNQLPISGGVAIFIAVIISYFVYSPEDLSGVRPNDSRAIEQVHGDQDVQARLWQDPFAAVAIHRNSKEKGTVQIRITGEVITPPLNKKKSTTAKIDINPSKASDANKSSKAQPHSFNNLIEQIANEFRESRKPINVLSVMVSAGPYPEDEEQRLRRRYAVIAGMAASGYQPENAAHIGYVENLSNIKARRCEGSHPDDILLPAITPYEWFKNSADGSYFLLLWLDENAFARKPLCKLDFLVGQITEKTTDVLKSLEYIEDSMPPPTPNFKIIGPSSSATLKAMTDELNEDEETLTALANPKGRVQFFSATATAQDSKLIPEDSWQHKDNGLDLVENIFKEHDLVLFRTIADDGDLADVLAAELNKRMYDFWYEDKIENFQIALVSEWDTLYGRALPDAFVESAQELMWKKKPDVFDEQWGKVRGEYNQLKKNSMMGDAAKKGKQASRKWNAVKSFRAAMQEWKQAPDKWNAANNYITARLLRATKQEWKQAVKKWNTAQNEWKKRTDGWDAANKFSNAKRDWERAAEKWKIAQNEWHKAPERWKAAQNEWNKAPGKWKAAKKKWEEVSATWEELEHFNAVMKAWEQAAAKWNTAKIVWKQKADKQDAENKFNIAMEALNQTSEKWEQAAEKWGKEKETWEQEHFYRFSYLRGIDGRIAGESQKEKSIGKDEKQRAEPNAIIDRPAGRSQRDYLRRLANDIQSRDQQLKNEGKKGICAIGILGSDVYDKLMILRVLRQRFPKAIFFTTDLDASLLHPDEFKWTRNMLVASSFDLKIADYQELQRVKTKDGDASNMLNILMTATKSTIPQFRDVYQTSVYLSTLWAANKESEMKMKNLEGYRLFNRLFKKNLDPRVYEISRNGAVELTRRGDQSWIDILMNKGEGQHIISPFYPTKPLAISPHSILIVAGCLVVFSLLAFAFWCRWIMTSDEDRMDDSLYRRELIQARWVTFVALVSLIILQIMKEISPGYMDIIVFIGYLLVAGLYCYWCRNIMGAKTIVLAVKALADAIAAVKGKEEAERIAAAKEQDVADSIAACGGIEKVSDVEMLRTEIAAAKNTAERLREKACLKIEEAKRATEKARTSGGRRR